jgi:hypothetical protein
MTRTCGSMVLFSATQISFLSNILGHAESRFVTGTDLISLVSMLENLGVFDHSEQFVQARTLYKHLIVKIYPFLGVF